MERIMGHIKRIPELLAPKIDTIKTNFDEWKVPWTQDRAEKLDNLDVAVSSRASAVTANNTQELAGLTLEKVRQLFPAGASETFTEPGTHTFTVPDDVGIVTVFCVGAGGGGGGGGRSSNLNVGRLGGGGGGGGMLENAISVTPGSDLTVIVGAGGSGGATPDGPGTGDTGGTGGSSSAGGIIATGGSGGRGGSSSVAGAPGAGGVPGGFPGSGRSGGEGPSAYGSYGSGGRGGSISEDSQDGSHGFVMLTY